MDIRLARAEDTASIMDLYHQASDAMVGTPYDCQWRRGGHPSAAFVRGLVTSNGMLVGTEGPQIVAAVGIDHDLGHEYRDVAWLTNAPLEHVAVLHLLVVSQLWRGKGLARQLLRACLDFVRNEGMTAARLDATANNLPAIELYASEGFEVVDHGTQDVGPKDDPLVPFVVMERLLG